MSASSLPSILRRLGLKPDKALGQHFLLHPHLARRIVAALQLTPQDLVVEIGPGLGALTVFLAREARRVVALELDPRLAAYLKEELFANSPQVNIVCQDILKFDLLRLSREVGAPLAVVGNLPYQITSPLLFKLAAEKAALSRAVLMLQQEVGDRLLATPGTKDYGVLSVLLQYHFHLASLFSLGPGNFYPPPQVTSVVVRLTPREPKPRAQDSEWFARVVKAAFASRRKTLRNTLASRRNPLGLPPAAVLAALSAQGLDPNRRGESLSLEQFVNLANELWLRKGSQPR